MPGPPRWAVAGWVRGTPFARRVLTFGSVASRVVRGAHRNPRGMVRGAHRNPYRRNERRRLRHASASRELPR